MAKKRAVTYARVSGDDKHKTGGENLADQTRLCKEYAEKQGYVVLATLEEDDRGARGADFDLPMINKAIDMAHNQEFDVLVVRELDRLARDMAKQIYIERELERTNVKIEYVLYDFPDTPEGRFQKHIHASVAELEKELIKRRMSRGKRRELRKGQLINHGHPPFGYQNTSVDGKRTLAIEEKEAQVVRTIFDLYLNGDGNSGPMSIRAIAKRLTKLRIPTYADRRRKGDCTTKSAMGHGEWGDSSVANILGNETYKGTWFYGQRGWDREDWIAFELFQCGD